MTPLLTEELQSLLAIVVQLAREAGQRIRGEFYRVSGPRGSKGKAPIDHEIERTLRAELLRALPTASYIGEELAEASDQHSLAGSEYCWLVDPQDGTQSFLEGWRGSTVSIALVHQGLPVLGVVYAPRAPTDAGDLWSWCEGLPLLRNGAPVQRHGSAALPTALSASVTVAVSQHADRAAGANVNILRGARYLSVPSVAYRLALAASGEADAVVSLAGVTWWDVAAGHALLRAVGGEILDEHATPLRYIGPRRVFDCFAGSLEISTELANSDWSLIRKKAAPNELARKYPRAWPHAARFIKDSDVLQRAQGCWLGQLTGDALGGQVEFMDPGGIRYLYPNGVTELRDGGVWNTLAGQPTDDSEMALILARTLLRDGQHDTTTMLGAYQDWLRSNPFDLGNTTRNALTGQRSFDSQANGALMRCSPLALWNLLSLAEHERSTLARADAQITHPHPICGDVNAVFVLTVAAAIREGLSPKETYQYALKTAQNERVHPVVTERLTLAAEQNVKEFGQQQGWVLTAFQNAFYQLLHSHSAREAMLNTVMCGGDTDTNAAICGVLVGAVFGRASLDPQWVGAVLTCRPQEGVQGVIHPRPPPFWPCDALELAEQLVYGPFDERAPRRGSRG